MSPRLAVPVAIAGATLWALTATAACVVLMVVSFVPYPRRADAGGGLASPAVSAFAPSAEAVADIPPSYLALYQGAAARFGLDWTILAGIGKVECDHGRDTDPSCTQEGHLNYAGAGGPAQFLVSTWKQYGISASGTGSPDMWNPADAIYSMANYLHAAGAPADYPRAIYAYNHAWWYVTDVLAWVRRYRARYGHAASITTGARMGTAALMHRPDGAITTGARAGMAALMHRPDGAITTGARMGMAALMRRPDGAITTGARVGTPS
jgi:hypothetical protein